MYAIALTPLYSYGMVAGIKRLHSTTQRGIVKRVVIKVLIIGVVTRIVVGVE